MPCAFLLLAVLQTPEIKPEVFAPWDISTVEFESHPEFSLDGRTLYFVRSTPQFTDWKIWVSHQEGDRWSKPTLALFSGTYRDADPFLTADGRRLFFISDRPSKHKKDKSMDIWWMPRSATGWGKPQRLGPEVNSETDEWYPTLDEKGTLYFGSARKGTLGGCDLWKSTMRNGRFLKCENLGPDVNTAADEIEPFITPDGKTLIFNSDRPGGQGGLDFYLSRWSGVSWWPAKAFPAPVNTKQTELSPKLSRDGKWFYYTGIAREKRGDIMRVPAESLGI